MQTHNSVMPLYTAYARKAHHAPKHNRIRKPHGPLFTKVPPLPVVWRSPEQAPHPKHAYWVDGVPAECGSHCPHANRGGPQLGRPADGYFVASGAGNLNKEGGREVLYGATMAIDWAQLH